MIKENFDYKEAAHKLDKFVRESRIKRDTVMFKKAVDECNIHLKKVVFDFLHPKTLDCKFQGLFPHI